MRKGRARIIRVPKWDPLAPRHEALRSHLRDLIITGAIAPNARMPSQRTLAFDLKLSRNTVTSAYEALISEGLLEGRPGAGTYVVENLSGAKARSRRLTAVPDPAPEMPLHQGVPDLTLFPLKVWRRLQERRWRNMPARHLGYGDPAGWSGLRFLLAQRVAATRGVICSPEQIQIVPTARAALHLACVALGVANRKAWIESPGYRRAAAGMTAAGALPVPVRVDAEGMVVASGVASAPDAALAYVTPSAQFPTGVALSPARRSALVQWAKNSNAWIFEDDYEADFVFEGEAPPSLAAEHGTDRVFYLSALNHVLFPAAQLACLVVPETLVDRFNAVREAIDGAVDLPLQLVTHDFIEGGYLAAHIRRCKDVYGERRSVLRRAIGARLGDVMRLVRQPIGLHVMAWLREGLDEARLERAAATRGVVVHSLQDGAAAAPATPPGLYMGFAGYAPQVIEQAVRKLERIAHTHEGQHANGA